MIISKDKQILRQLKCFSIQKEQNSLYRQQRKIEKANWTKLQ